VPFQRRVSNPSSQPRRLNPSSQPDRSGVIDDPR
jgi:hypothetical protein